MLQEGDVCEETGASRSVKTAITCCATNQMEADGQATSPVAILVSIQVCMYVVEERGTTLTGQSTARAQCTNRAPCLSKMLGFPDDNVLPPQCYGRDNTRRVLSFA